MVTLGKQLEDKYNLRDGVDPQTYGIGIKELWEVPAENHHPGLVVHTAGWPMNSATYGGGFVYHLEDNLVSVGYVVGDSTTPIPTYRRSRSSNAIRRTPRYVRTSKAVALEPMEPAPSPQAACRANPAGLPRRRADRRRCRFPQRRADQR